MVTPKVESPVRLLMEKVMQLASANARLAAANRPDKVHHSLLTSLPGMLRSLGLIPGLAADPQEMTSPADGQSGNASLREDLPDRFFTVTP